MIDIQDIREAAEAALGEVAGNGAGELAGKAALGEAARKAARKAAEAAPDEAGDGKFLVEVTGRGDEFEVFIDCDGAGEDGKPRRITVEDCVRLTKAIEARFDRDEPENDFSLTVSSAGIGQPLRVPRQYRKLVGRQVEVVLASGTKLVATLEAIEPDGRGPKTNGSAANGADGRGSAANGSAASGGMESITLSYPEKQRTEGQKRPQIVTVTKTFAMNEVKTTKEYIDFK